MIHQHALWHVDTICQSVITVRAVTECTKSEIIIIIIIIGNLKNKYSERKNIAAYPAGSVKYLSSKF